MFSRFTKFSYLYRGILALGVVSLAAPLGATGVLTGDQPLQFESGVWTQWRGSGSDALTSGRAWPSSLDGLTELWRSDLGSGYSGPLLVGEKVFVSETVDGETEGARAFRVSDGTELWRTTWPGSGKVPFFAQRNGDWIRSTPAHDGEALYVGGMQEVLHKLDSETGEILWSVDFPARFGTGIPDFGFASSPLFAEAGAAGGDAALFVQAANSMIRLHPASGEVAWRALENDGDIMRSGAFSSPILAELAGRQQLLVQTREVLYGLDPADGRVLWKQPVPSFRGMNILTPTVIGDRIFTSTHRNRSFLYEVRASDEGFEVEEVWSNKSQGYMSSPVHHQGRIYLHMGNGRLSVLDVESGETTWTSKPFGDYWSLVRRADSALALDSGGELILLDLAADAPRVLATKKVSDQSTWGHLAVSGDLVAVRELNGVRVLYFGRNN